jgi:superfamily II DNA/RNA helicase
MIPTIKSFFRKIKRTLEFLPLIWEGYDFDYRYALDLFHYQLKRTADFLESDRAYSFNAKQDARRLRTILELMKKVYDEEYRMEHFDQTEKIYGKWSMNWVDNEDKYSKYMGSKWEFADTPEKEKEAEEMFSKLAAVAEKKHQRAKKLLWELVEHNLEHFWD